jgi:WYL domain-containing protein
MRQPEQPTILLIFWYFLAYLSQNLCNPQPHQSGQFYPLIQKPMELGLSIRAIEMHQTITQAITERRLLTIYYEPGPRIIEPYAYGLSGEHHGLLRAFQTSGASASGDHVNWKLFRTDRITQIRILGDQFYGQRPEYRRNDRAMTGGIYCQL